MSENRQSSSLFGDDTTKEEILAQRHHIPKNLSKNTFGGKFVDPARIFHTGSLHKCSAQVGRWDERHFVLMKNRLVYYLRKEDMPQFNKGRLGDPRGDFILNQDCQIAAEDPGWTQPHPHGFSISNVVIGSLGLGAEASFAGNKSHTSLASAEKSSEALAAKTVLYLCADSEGGKNAWNNALLTAIKDSDGKPEYIPHEACLDRTCFTLHIPKLKTGDSFSVKVDGDDKSILLSLSDAGLLSWYDILFGKEIGSVHIDSVSKVVYTVGGAVASSTKKTSTFTIFTDGTSYNPVAIRKGGHLVDGVCHKKQFTVKYSHQVSS